MAASRGKREEEGAVSHRESQKTAEPQPCPALMNLPQKGGFAQGKAL